MAQPSGGACKTVAAVADFGVDGGIRLIGEPDAINVCRMQQTDANERIGKVTADASGI